MITLHPVKPEEKEILWNYLQKYLYELSGIYGLELEIVKFPGEKLPKLPDCAKLILRSWNPELDEPFHDLSDLKNTDLSWESY